MAPAADWASALLHAPSSSRLVLQALVETMDGADFFVPAPSTGPATLSASLLAAMKPGAAAQQGGGAGAPAASLIEEALRREAQRKLE